MKVEVRKTVDGVLTLPEKHGYVLTGINAWIDPASAREYALNLLAKAMKAEAEREARATRVMVAVQEAIASDGEAL